MGSYNPLSERGQNFTIEKFSDSGRLESKLSASYVIYDTAKHKVDCNELLYTGNK